MLSGIAKFLFYLSSLLPIVFVYAVISVIMGHYEVCISSLILCLGFVFTGSYLLNHSKNNFPRENLRITSIEKVNRDSFLILIFYLFPLLGIYLNYKWMFLGFLLIGVLSDELFVFPPWLCIYGYRLYRVGTEGNKTYSFVSKQKIYNKEQKFTACELTDDVLLEI